MKKQKQNNEYMTVDEVAEMFKVSTKWVYKQKAEGIFPYYKLGNTLRFIKGEIEDAFDRHYGEA